MKLKVFNYFKVRQIEKICLSNIIKYLSVICFAITSLFFSSPIESFLKLKVPQFEKDNQTAQVHFIDVGQGDCIAVRFNNGKTMLIDSGVANQEKKLIKYLDEIFFKGYDKIFDYVILTHTDTDHYGNMNLILSRYNIGKFYVPPNYNESTSINEIKNTVNRKQITIEENIDDLKLEFEENTVNWYMAGTDLLDDNSLCPMLYFNLNGKKMLLTGDLNIESENLLLYANNIEKVDVLKAGHHGSKSSTGKMILEETTPNFLIISVGENTYGHPSSELIERVADFNLTHNKEISILRTDKLGNIILNFKNNDISVSTLSNINDSFIISWWVIVLIFVLSYSLYFVFARKYVINKMYEKNLKASESKDKE